MLVTNAIKANYFDGRSVRPIAGYIQIKDQQLLFINDSFNPDLIKQEQDLSTDLQPQLNNQQVTSIELFWPLEQIEFPEEMGQEVALISLPNFASIEPRFSECVGVIEIGSDFTGGTNGSTCTDGST